MSQQQASSPTVAIESVLLSCVIDALERRVVKIADIPGAYLHSDMDSLVHARFDGTLAEQLIEIKPSLYKKYATNIRGKTALFVILRKALYGCLNSGKLFWKNLTNVLSKKMGFELNPYDSCVMNKTINGKQCTVMFHVDDLKISHAEESVVDDVIQQLEAVYGKMVVSQGEKLDYLGMTLNYEKEGIVSIEMKQFVSNILNESPEDFNGTAATPAANFLFTTNEDAEKLNETQAKMFHTYVAKLLFLCKRARPDLQTAVAFLTTRVQSPDIDDWKKLSRTIRYLRLTLDLCLILSIEKNVISKWWIDGAFAVHPNMRSHTGGTHSLGRGHIYSSSIKQKLVTRSSTEAELVGVHDILPQVLWTKYFLEAQGFKLHDTTVYQDNLSAIMLEENGKLSSSRRTRHINIRFFFVKDVVERGDIKIEYEPTEVMVADYFTKPLQGAAFKKFRDIIMGIRGQ